MTTWYTGAQGLRAYSVRPDLWPPGSYCWVQGAGKRSLADWGNPDPANVDLAYTAPGSAEALVLGGLLEWGPAGTTLGRRIPWSETATLPI